MTQPTNQPIPVLRFIMQEALPTAQPVLKREEAMQALRHLLEEPRSKPESVKTHLKRRDQSWMWKPARTMLSCATGTRRTGMWRVCW